MFGNKFNDWNVLLTIKYKDYCSFTITIHYLSSVSNHISVFLGKELKFSNTSKILEVIVFVVVCLFG